MSCSLFIFFFLLTLAGVFEFRTSITNEIKGVRIFCALTEEYDELQIQCTFSWNIEFFQKLKFVHFCGFLYYKVLEQFLVFLENSTLARPVPTKTTLILQLIAVLYSLCEENFKNCDFVFLCVFYSMKTSHL